VPSSPVFGQGVTFTATVTSTGGVPTGTVTFADGASTLGMRTLNGSGQAVLSTSSLSTGAHSIAATYGGDGNFTGSTTSLNLTVGQASTTLTLSSNTNPSRPGQSVTFTATLTPQFGGQATGTIDFRDGATPLGSPAVSGNSAALGTSLVTAGIHSITAHYGGDTNFTASTSNTLSQAVTPAVSRVDFDADGKNDLAVFHDASGLWFIKYSSTGAVATVGYGASGYIPVPGDYDGDGKTDIAVYHPPTGLWFIRSSSTGTDSATGFGGTGYAPVRGDFDGDGKTDLAVFHDATGLWFIKYSSTGAVVTVGYGGSGYIPVPGDYDGDGKTDIAVYHPPTGLWFIRSSSTGADSVTGFGGTGYNPIN
jgi:hypothetical protein